MAPRNPLSLSQAAKATGRHRNTIRNALVNDRFPNAYRDGSGSWRIPTDDLIAAGFTLYAPSPADPEGGAEATATPSTSSPNEDVERLRAEVVELRRRVELAEAIAAERERIVERLLAVLPALPAEGRTRRWPWSRRADR